MIIATDVHYDDTCFRANAACIAFSNWTDTTGIEHSTPVEGVEPYEPGAFYKRELPCILAVLQLAQHYDVVVIDGYVDLAPGHAGLGRHLYESVKVPVVGVAKTYFKGSQAVEILRGQSMSPLYVTAAGMGSDVAAQLVQSMAGPHRIPTLLQRVDALSRGWNLTATG